MRVVTRQALWPCLWPIAIAAWVSFDLNVEPVSRDLSSNPRLTQSVAEADSQRVLKDARSKQAGFERLRRSYFPKGLDAGSQQCDEQIGRFCLWHPADVEPREWPRAEPPAVGAAREDLIAELASAGAILPADEWIVGQRVRYLVEAGRPSAAVRIPCEATAWWCAALDGYAWHAAGEFARAQSAFAEALSTMPQEERCRWTDISLFLRGDWKRRYRRLPCEERDAIERRFWWLADPLYSYPGNDRRTEHFARLVIDRLQRDAESGFDVKWGRDLRQILVRYGWPAAWEQVRTWSVQDAGRARVAAHHPDESRQFLPPSKFLDDPSAIAEDAWDLDPERSFSGYAPSYATSFDHLEHQLAIFRRGDSALVVAAYALPESLWGRGPVRASLVLARDEVSGPAIASREGDEREAALSLGTRRESGLLSVEAIAAGAAARARYGLRVPEGPDGVLALSDLLLLRPTEPLPQTLAEAIPLALGALRVRPGQAIGLYWEVYGLQSGPEELAVSLSVRRADKGALRTLAEWIGLAESDPPVSLHWQEWSDAGKAIESRSISLTLSDITPGEYVIALEISAYGREPVSAIRRIVVEP